MMLWISHFENNQSEHADLCVFLTPCQLGHLTLEDYQIWSVKSALANEFLNLLFQVGPSHDVAVQVALILKIQHFFLHLFVFVLFQVCHIVLGLRPGTPEEEGQIIRLEPVLPLCHIVVYSLEENRPAECSSFLFRV